MKQIVTKALCLVCAGALALSMVGCGKEAASSSTASQTTASPFQSAASYDYANFSYSTGLDENGYWTGVKALDHVTLPEDYAAVSIARAEVEPSAEEVQSQINNLLDQHATTQDVTDRAAVNGDTVNIDYVGKVNGVVFTGGSYSGYNLMLGSGSFIDGFEEQIVGHTPGEVFDITVTFPEGYSDSTDADGNTVVLSGKEAVFTITLNAIREQVLPALTDAWVDATYGTTDELHSVAELELFFHDQLFASNLQSAIMDYLMENSTFGDIPQSVMDYQVTQCLNYYYSMASYYGYDLDSFVQTLMGYESADDMLAQMADSIQSYAQEALLYQALAEALELTPAQERLDAYTAYNESYGANYCALIALMDTVSDALTSGAQVN